MSVPAQVITTVRLENAGRAPLEAGVASFGQAFARGDLPAGSGLSALGAGGGALDVQMDVKTRHEDGSVKFAVLSVARPALGAGEGMEVSLSARSPEPAAPPIDLASALAGRSFEVDILPAGGGEPLRIDGLAALRGALADGTASFWQRGPLVSEARVEVDLPGSMRLVLDVSAHRDGEFSVRAGFNNDQAMGPVGGRAEYTAVVRLDGREVAREGVDQAQYQNWGDSWSSGGANGGQGLGSPEGGWLNIRHDVGYLADSAALPRFDATLRIPEESLARMEGMARAPGFGEPLATNGVTESMGATGARPDIGITTGWNASWLISGDPRAAAVGLGQAEASGAVPWNFWDAGNRTWLNTENYPRLWTDPRGGTGRPGDPSSGGLTQQAEATDIGPVRSHQPDLSFVPYVLTGERWILDGLMAQSSWTVMTVWPAPRKSGESLLVNESQIRSAAWSMRQVENAAWAAPDGSPEKAWFRSVADANWDFILENIPAWTAEQGEAHGYIPSFAGSTGVAPWQQDYFASTAIQAAARGNGKAMAYLEWARNFLVGRFEAHEGWNPLDGTAYALRVVDPATGQRHTTWAEIGAAAAREGQARGDTWTGTPGDYARLAASTLAGLVHLTGDPEALAAYTMLMQNSAPGLGAESLGRAPQFSVTLPGFHSGTVRGTDGDDSVAPRAGGQRLDVDLGEGFDVFAAGAGPNAGSFRNVEVVVGRDGADRFTVHAARDGTAVLGGAGSDEAAFGDGGGTLRVREVERVLGGAGDDRLVVMDADPAASVLFEGRGGQDSVELGHGARARLVLRDVEEARGGAGDDSFEVLGSASSLPVRVDGGAGVDTLRLGNNGVAEGRDVERVLGTASGNETFVAAAGLRGATVDLGSGGTDILRFADGGGASVEAREVERVFGGSGDDHLRLFAPGPSIQVAMGAGRDSVELLAAPGSGARGVFLAGAERVLGTEGADDVAWRGAEGDARVDLRGGEDRLVLEAAFRGTLAGVERVETRSSFDDAVRLEGAVRGVRLDLAGGTDSVALADGGSHVILSGVESVAGGSGDDLVVFSSNAQATVDGGAGRDRVELAGAGTNRLSARGVEDILGGAGADEVTLLSPGQGVRLALGGGTDLVRLADGGGRVALRDVERALGGGGDDTVTVEALAPGAVLSFSGGAGRDALDLSALSGGSSSRVDGVESVRGGAGRDEVVVAGAATGSSLLALSLGAGSDRVTVAHGGGGVYELSGVEFFAGGGGADRVVLRDAGAAGTRVEGGWGADEVVLAGSGPFLLDLASVEALSGGTGGETVRLLSAVQGLRADLGGGSDTLQLAGGTNSLSVQGVETVLGGSGNDAVTALGARTTVEARFDLGAGVDALDLRGVQGGAFAAVSGAERVTGGAGADALRLSWSAAPAQAVTVDAGAGDDALTLSWSLPALSATLAGGDGSDRLVLLSGGGQLVLSGFEDVRGSAGDDRLSFSQAVQNLSVQGGAGSDSVVLANGANRVAVAGVERVTGGTGADVVSVVDALRAILEGGAGADTLSGGSGDDLLRGGSGADLLRGGAGRDTFAFASGELASPDRDRIADFFAPEDTLLFEGVSGAGFSWRGGDALRAGGGLQARFDDASSTLFLDRNGDGRADWSAVMEGVRAAMLSAQDFTWA